MNDLQKKTQKKKKKGGVKPTLFYREIPLIYVRMYMKVNAIKSLRFKVLKIIK